VGIQTVVVVILKKSIMSKTNIVVVNSRLTRSFNVTKLSLLSTSKHPDHSAIQIVQRILIV